MTYVTADSKCLYYKADHNRLYNNNNQLYIIPYWDDSDPCEWTFNPLPSAAHLFPAHVTKVSCGGIECRNHLDYTTDLIWCEDCLGSPYLNRTTYCDLFVIKTLKLYL